MMLPESFVLWFAIVASQSSSFVPISTFHRQNVVASPTGTTLLMGKGLNKAKNKQADLAKKMALAKQQRDGADVSEPVNLVETPSRRLSDEEIKKRNDLLRFEQLLNAGGSTMGEYTGDNYLTKRQEEEEINAARSGADLLFVGDPAPTLCFEELVSIRSEQPIGLGGASRMVPWLRKNELRRNEYLIIISDPRLKSPELRQTMKNLRTELSEDILSRLIIVNADSPSENRRWIKQNCELDVFSDEKMEWMQAYTALGEKRWSMTIFVVADERIQKLVREVDALQATHAINSMVRSLNVV